MEGAVNHPASHGLGLPIDKYEERILNEIKEHRVTIIRGETGCGKSSRIPAMLLRSPPPDPSSVEKVKFFCAVPRRIAVKSLVERLRSSEPSIKDLIALRMGDGIREYETMDTRAWFVTTGYLVRFLASQDNSLADHSHLIIDEVHERSVDADVLCLLCRRILERNDHIRLVLMSATLEAGRYNTYFNIKRPPINVLFRPFELREVFVEHILEEFAMLKEQEKKTAASIQKFCSTSRCQSAPSERYVRNLLSLAAQITLMVGRPGSCVLIFVPGMIETIALGEEIEKLRTRDHKIRFTFVPIHSEIPYEDQMVVFKPPKQNEVKVIVATNSAQSGITLPHVDHVICLGLSKQIQYNESSHRQKLVMSWISNACAKQRAGRTGRVRPGTVYRLYTREAFTSFLEKFEPGEILRTPLDHVILYLKKMMQEDAQKILSKCIEPPKLSTVKRSLQSLFERNYITNPDNSGKITHRGSFVLAAGMDLALGSLVGLGIQFGVGPEALEMAAILSFSKPAWIIAIPTFHSVEEFNDITSKSFVSRCHFDANLYSEPLGIMNLVWDFERATNKNDFCWFYKVSRTRIKQLIATRDNIRRRVANFFGIDSNRLAVEKPPVQMPHSKLVILRIIQVWAFADTIASKKMPASMKCLQDESVVVPIEGDTIHEEDVESVLIKERHPFRLNYKDKFFRQGSFTLAPGTAFDTTCFERRFLDLAHKKNCDFAVYGSAKGLLLLGSDNKSYDHICCALRLNLDGERRHLVKQRESGWWSATFDLTASVSELVQYTTQPPETIESHLRQKLDTLTFICCYLPTQIEAEGYIEFSISFCSKKIADLSDCVVALTQKDLVDLFASSTVEVEATKSVREQNITFLMEGANNKAWPYNRSSNDKFATSVVSPETSWSRPLLQDILEGVRLLSLLGKREQKKAVLKLQCKYGKKISLVKALTIDMEKVAGRWTRFGTNLGVGLNENSVPASAMPLHPNGELFACCANTIELAGGRLSAEGLTLLPPGRLFLALSFVTFGLKLPFSRTQSFDDEESLVNQILLWENEKGKDNDRPGLPDSEKRRRVVLALEFNKSCCARLGEDPVCYPSYVQKLCEIFDLVDGFPAEPWQSLHTNIFVPSERTNQIAAKQVCEIKNSRESEVTNEFLLNHTTRLHSIDGQSMSEGNQPNEETRSQHETFHDETRLPNLPSTGSVDSYGKQQSVVELKAYVLETAHHNRVAIQSPMTSGGTDEPTRQAVADEIESSGCKEAGTTSLNTSPQNIASRQRVYLTTFPPPSLAYLNLLVSNYCVALLKDKRTSKNNRASIKKVSSLSNDCWIFHTVTDSKAREWFKAEFLPTVVPLTNFEHDDNAPDWIKKGRKRPNTWDDAVSCVPLKQLGSSQNQHPCIRVAKPEPMLYFSSIEFAIGMEAGFWLSKHFQKGKKTWHEQSLQKMESELLDVKPAFLNAVEDHGSDSFSQDPVTNTTMASCKPQDKDCCRLSNVDSAAISSESCQSNSLQSLQTSDPVLYNFACEVRSLNFFTKKFPFPSLAILNFLVGNYCTALFEDTRLTLTERTEMKETCNPPLSDEHWKLDSCQQKDGKEWVRAEYVHKIVPIRDITNENKLPAWIAAGKARPDSLVDAKKCFPEWKDIQVLVANTSSELKQQKALFFENARVAMGMEAAFWLSRQFQKKSKTWYEISLRDMEKELMKLLPRTNQ